MAENRGLKNATIITKLALILLALVFVSGCATSYDKKGRYHVVRKGESVWSISKAYRSDIQQLAEMNNILSPSDVVAGQKLYIPPHEKKPSFKKLLFGEKTETTTDKHSRGKNTAQEDKGQIRTFRGKFIWPVEGSISSLFGMRNGRRHDGIDISAPKGTSIKASASGRVVYEGSMRGYGNLILLRHSDDMFTSYAHNDKNKVKKGDSVKQGQVIGTVGRTGRASGNHLHFEIRNGQTARNPLFFLPERKGK